MKTDELREKYLEFFVSKGCTRKASDVLVPTWDPSVLFTPAGMNQFKDHFLGKCKLEFTKATTCQKCLRTGDIDNVGRTAYHHTFFEMLGNFSFGDYFKKEAIHWAWEFLTSKKWLGLDGNKLSVTVYLDDDEAAGIWNKEIGLEEARISRCGEDENFWPAEAPSKGPDGVCGPCSEIYYETSPGKKVEIWNLVFTQFNRVGAPPNNLRPLPSKNIDTGMGLERCAAVLQGVETNYHIDSIKPLVLAAGEVAGKKYDPDSDDGRRLRRIADHVRACTFAIHENVYPGANKAPYVIRRLMRRAILDGYQMGLRAPFLWQLVPKVVELMKNPYPELDETIERVQGVMKLEENLFMGMVDNGLSRVEHMFGEMKKSGSTIVPGNESAELYQTHGFPPELIETIAGDQKFTFDWNGYKAAMEEFGKKSGGGGFELFQTGPIESLKKTTKATEFKGYTEIEIKGAKILGLVQGNATVDKIVATSDEQPAVIVLDQTPFYGESGGQVGDFGRITSSDGLDFEVLDTQKNGELFLHIGQLRAGTLQVNKEVTASVDTRRRNGIRRAHSATHILHHALQKYLGKHAQQKGSKVENDILRFDFTNMAAIESDVIAKIEDDVNDHILSADAVAWKNMPIAEARQTGAMMLFGEKYPEVVRMVSIGEFSKELCGGTHVNNTGEIGMFRITRESSVSSGVRRIEAVTGHEALARARSSEAAITEVAHLLRTSTAEVLKRVTALVNEVRDLKKAVSIGAKAGVSLDKLLAEATDVKGTTVVIADASGVEAQGLREMIDTIRKKTKSSAILLAAGEEGKVTIVCGISRDLQERKLSAGEWIKGPAEAVGGRGGGRPDMAQAGGKNAAALSDALKAAKDSIEKMLSA